jgi:hypothetical protein
MKTIKNIRELENIESVLDDYSFQPELTEKLDALESKFDQKTINEIVLWKVNRYAQVSDNCLNLLNRIDPNSEQIDEGITKEILNQLLSTKGIRLPMASTILRFKAPNIYQIYDQRVFRYLYGFNSTSSTVIEKQINTYIKYLKDLRKECQINDIQFTLSDRILYQADKIQNSSIPIKY